MLSLSLLSPLPFFQKMQGPCKFLPELAATAMPRVLTMSSPCSAPGKGPLRLPGIPFKWALFL